MKNPRVLMATDFMAQWKIMGGKSIAHCKSLDFTFLPFTFLPFEGGQKIQKCLPGSMDQEAVW